MLTQVGIRRNMPMKSAWEKVAEALDFTEEGDNTIIIIIIIISWYFSY